MWGQPPPAVLRAQRGVWGGHSCPPPLILTSANESRPLIAGHRRLQQTQSARRTHIGKLGVQERLPIFRLKLLQPVNHLRDRNRERTLAIGIQPLQAPSIPLDPLPSSIRVIPHGARNLRCKALRILANQPTMVARHSSEFWRCEQLRQLLQLLFRHFPVKPIRQSEGPGADDPILSVPRDRHTNVPHPVGLHHHTGAFIRKPRQQGGIMVTRFLRRHSKRDEKERNSQKHFSMGAHCRTSCEGLNHSSF
jgi:hypothetical protein